MPLVPLVPLVPDVPLVPLVPDVPDVPDVPLVPLVPLVPDVPLEPLDVEPEAPLDVEVLCPPPPLALVPPPPSDVGGRSSSSEHATKTVAAAHVKTIPVKRTKLRMADVSCTARASMKRDHETSRTKTNAARAAAARVTKAPRVAGTRAGLSGAAAAR